MRKWIPLDIINPFDGGHSEKMDGPHREGTDEVKELIRQNKRILPILVKPVEGKPYKYQRLDGYKRYFAHKELGRREIECIIDPKGTAGGQGGFPWIEPRKAVVTITIGSDWDKHALYSHPSFRAYAQRTGSDFIVFNKQRFPDKNISYEFFQIKDLIGSGYKRILHINTDAFIKPDCPDLFNIVPYNEVGGVYDTEQNKPANEDRIIEIMKVLGNIGWQKGYINSGMFMVSDIHKGLFEIPENALSGWMWDQHVLNYNIYRLGFPIFRLDARFNAMYLYGYPTNGEPQDIDAYIVHYAACSERWKGLKFLYDKYKDQMR